MSVSECSSLSPPGSGSEKSSTSQLPGACTAGVAPHLFSSIQQQYAAATAAAIAAAAANANAHHPYHQHHHQQHQSGTDNAMSTAAAAAASNVTPSELVVGKKRSAETDIFQLVYLFLGDMISYP